MGKAGWTSVFLVLTLAAGRPLRAQDLAVGKLLVASRDIVDANFAQTVVLLVRHDRRASMGLILNRPSNVPLSVALEGMKQAEDEADPIYIGGPVGRSGALALLRTRTAPPKAASVMDGLYLISSRAELAEALAASAASGSLRVYMGYAGWSAGRLESEVARRNWHVVQGSVAAVFDPYPGSLWRRLISGAEPKLARSTFTAGGTRRAFPPPYGPR